LHWLIFPCKSIGISYVAGFLDAMQIEWADDGAAKKFLDDCKGLTLGQLVDAMTKFYQENPKWRDIEPAKILTVIIPRLQQGLTPVPSEKENK